MQEGMQQLLDMEIAQMDGVQFQGWTQKHNWEFSTEEEVAKNRFYHIREVH